MTEATGKPSIVRKKPKSVHAGGLFRATGHKTKTKTKMVGDAAPDQVFREEDDFYPTPDGATDALICAEWDRLKQIKTLWECAAGDGAMAKRLTRCGFNVAMSDLIDRGAGATISNFYDYTTPLGDGIFSNPPYNEINASQGHGAWLRHTKELNVDYVAYLLSWDWAAATKNGLGKLLEEYPFSRVYLCRWKIDFTRMGAPPQRNGWFIWDKLDQPKHPEFRFLDRADPMQAKMKI